MYLLIIFLPLIATFINNRFLGIKWGPFLSIFLIGNGLILSMIAYYELLCSSSAISINLGSWLNIFNILIEWNFLFDSLTISLLFPIYFISFLVQIYS